MAKRISQPQDESSLLAAAKERPSPLYLFIGEPFRTESVAHALIDILVPPQRRSFNLEIYDGRTTAISVVVDSLRTRGLFPGTKVIWVREPTLFLTAEKRTDITAALIAAWSEERAGDAAEKYLTLAAMAGWTQNLFDEIDWARISSKDIEELLGRTCEAEERQVLSAVHAYCKDRGLSVGGYRDESGLLSDFLNRGMPAESVLLFTAAAVDRRKRIVKTIAEIGSVLELNLERERSGILSAESMDVVINRVLEREGKRLSAGGRRLIHQRSGTDAAALALEIEKLCLYAGEAQEIGEEDVRESFRDLAESWIFDFTKAFSQRDAASAVRLLRGLFAQGEHPLRILALIARELRILLLARDCLTGSLAGRWNPRASFAIFRDNIWPQTIAEDRDGFAGVHPYAIYLAMQNAGRMKTAELHRGILRLHQLDVKIKSSIGDPRILLEALVLELCTGQRFGRR